jgi:hypothetical protein
MSSNVSLDNANTGFVETIQSLNFLDSGADDDDWGTMDSSIMSGLTDALSNISSVDDSSTVKQPAQEPEQFVLEEKSDLDESVCVLEGSDDDKSEYGDVDDVATEPTIDEVEFDSPELDEADLKADEVALIYESRCVGLIPPINDDDLETRYVWPVTFEPIIGKKGRYPLSRVLTIYYESETEELIATWHFRGYDGIMKVAIMMVCLLIEQDEQFVYHSMEVDSENPNYLSKNAWISIDELKMLEQRLMAMNLPANSDTVTYSEALRVFGDVVSFDNVYLSNSDGPGGVIAKTILSCLFSSTGRRLFVNVYNCVEEASYFDFHMTYYHMQIPLYHEISNVSERVTMLQSTDWLSYRVTTMDGIMSEFGNNPYGVVHIDHLESAYHINRFYPGDHSDSIPKMGRAKGISYHLHARLVSMVQHLLTHLEYVESSLVIRSERSFDDGMFLPVRACDFKEEVSVVSRPELILYQFMCTHKKIPTTLYKFYAPVVDEFYNSKGNDRMTIKNTLDLVISHTILFYASYFSKTREGKDFDYVLSRCECDVDFDGVTVTYMMPPTFYQSYHPLVTMVYYLSRDSEDFQEEYDIFKEHRKSIVNFKDHSVGHMLFNSTIGVESFSYVDVSACDDRTWSEKSKNRATLKSVARMKKEGKSTRQLKREARRAKRRLKEMPDDPSVYAKGLKLCEVAFSHQGYDVIPYESILRNENFVGSIVWGQRDFVTEIPDIMRLFGLYGVDITLSPERLSFITTANIVYCDARQVLKYGFNSKQAAKALGYRKLCEFCKKFYKKLTPLAYMIYGQHERCSCMKKFVPKGFERSTENMIQIQYGTIIPLWKKGIAPRWSTGVRFTYPGPQREVREDMLFSHNDYESVNFYITD